MIQMSKREKAYVSIAGGFAGVVLLWLAIVNPYLKGMASAKNRIEEGRQNLRTVVQLYDTYVTRKARMAELERKIPAGSEFAVLSALERLAGEAGISDKIEKMEEHKKPDNLFFQENAVEVSLRRVPLPSLIDYLYKIEASKDLLLVRKLQLSTRYDQRELIDATVEVSTFRPL
jgi:type II secretory pathway component PulM